MMATYPQNMFSYTTQLGPSLPPSAHLLTSSARRSAIAVSSISPPTELVWLVLTVWYRPPVTWRRERDREWAPRLYTRAKLREGGKEGGRKEE